MRYFYQKKSFIIVWGSEPVGFLLENEEAVAGFKKYFDAFWKIAKKGERGKTSKAKKSEKENKKRVLKTQNNHLS